MGVWGGGLGEERWLWLRLSRVKIQFSYVVHCSISLFYKIPSIERSKREYRDSVLMSAFSFAALEEGLR